MTPTAAFAADVKLAHDLIILRDLADLNNDRATYRRAFVELYRIDGHAVTEAEQKREVEAQAEQKREVA